MDYIGSTASSLGADWLKGCHSYNKVPPPLKPPVVAVLGVDKCVCEGGGGATASCQGDTLANSGKKGDSSRAQAHESFNLFYFLKHATHIGTRLLLCLNS